MNSSLVHSKIFLVISKVKFMLWGPCSLSKSIYFNSHLATLTGDLESMHRWFHPSSAELLVQLAYSSPDSTSFMTRSRRQTGIPTLRSACLACLGGTIKRKIVSGRLAENLRPYAGPDRSKLALLT